LNKIKFILWVNSLKSSIFYKFALLFAITDLKKELKKTIYKNFSYRFYR